MEIHVLAYVIEQGLSEVLLGILNGIGSALGIVGTLVYPYFVKRLGLIRTGVIGFWSEFSTLILCLLSLFTHGTLFSPFRNIALGSCHDHEMSNQTTTTNFLQFPCVHSKSSVFLLIMGITLNRFGKEFSDGCFAARWASSVFVGLWIADLTVNQLQQERVPEAIRGRIGGMQHSLNQFFDMLRYILIVVLPQMPQFGYHVCLSVLSVFCASLIYTLWSCSPVSQLVPPTGDIELTDVPADDLATHYETSLNEKLDFIDDGSAKV